MDDRNKRTAHGARLLASAALAVGALTACGGGGSASGVAAQTVALPTTSSMATAAGMAPATTAATSGGLVATADTAGTTATGGTASALGKSSGSAAARPVAQPANTEGRLLASNCFQCHGTLGTGGFDRIRGKDANEVLEFMTKNPSKDIMAAHAQGYTPAQLQKIIAYLQQ